MNRITMSIISLALLSIAGAEQSNPYTASNVSAIAELAAYAYGYERSSDYAKNKAWTEKKKRYYQEVLKATDVSKIAPIEADRWSIIASTAGSQEKSLTLLNRYIEQEKDPILVFRGMTRVLQLTRDMGGVAEVIRLIPKVKINRLAEAARLTHFVTYLDPFPAEERLKLLDLMESKLDSQEKEPFYKGVPVFIPNVETETVDGTMKEAGMARVAIALARYQDLHALGRTSEGQKVLEAALVNKNTELGHRHFLTMKLVHSRLSDAQFPEIPVIERLGKSNKLSSYRGKTVILFFFSRIHPNAWELLKEFSAFAKAHKADGVEVIGVTQYTGVTDDKGTERIKPPQELQALKLQLKEHKIEVPVVVTSWPNYELITGLGGTPQAVLLRKDGYAVDAFMVGNRNVLPQITQKALEVSRSTPSKVAVRSIR